MLYLNARNMLIRNEPLSEGSVDEAAVYVREVIRRALEYHATAMILVHNHPSGDPQPSQQDIRLTREIIEAAGRSGSRCTTMSSSARGAAPACGRWG